MTRHEFLAALHDLLRPRTYLEVGVQYGTSLNLAVHSQAAWGIDPNPLIEPTDNQILARVTSDEYFAIRNQIAVGDPRADAPIDLAFIDGMHLFEYALRDFQNIERYCHPRTVVVFDDVLPRNQWEARRLAPTDPVLGDWTGDVWKTAIVLEAHRSQLRYRWVDTQPTGICTVTCFPGAYTPWSLAQDVVEQWSAIDIVPDHILERAGARDPQQVLDEIAKELTP